MYKKTIYILTLIFFVTSCEGMKTAKKTLTGEKKNSTDEFLIQKKDPLILPPDYENLPSPDEEIDVTEKISNFEKSLGNMTEDEDNVSSQSSVEDSILKKIRSK